MPQVVHDLDKLGPIDGWTKEKVFEPDVILGSQLTAHPNASPERRLVIAFLSCALMDAEDGSLTVGMKLRKPTTSMEPRKGTLGAYAEKRRMKAREWILSEEREWAFSFLRVCELLDLEPSYVRRTVMKRWQ